MYKQALASHHQHVVVGVAVVVGVFRLASTGSLCSRKFSKFALPRHQLLVLVVEVSCLAARGLEHPRHS